MTGTIINIIAVVVGSSLGVAFGGRLPERLHQTVVWGLGLFVLGLGVQMFLKTQNSLIAAGSLLVGALLGEWWQIEEGLKKFGAWLEQRFNRGRAGDAARFVRGFLAASLVFCVGPLAILGSLAICLWLVHANGLGLPWVGLAVAVSASNTALELFSPRGTDDFTMATGNALLCWAFGRLVY